MGRRRQWKSKQQSGQNDRKRRWKREQRGEVDKVMANREAIAGNRGGRLVSADPSTVLEIHYNKGLLF